MNFLPLLLATTMQTSTIGFYIGTYTSPGGSEGIYHARLNLETGEISTPALVAKAENPSFLALSKPDKSLYVVLETENGNVQSYAIGADGSLKLTSTAPSMGDAPCHVVVAPDQRMLLVANYSSGSLTTLGLNPDGSIAPTETKNFPNDGSGPDKSRQESSHVHCAYFDAAHGYAYACDLGTDQVLIYRVGETLNPNNPPDAKVPAGSGPRHLTVHPNGQFVYVNNEMANTVTVFARFLSSGILEPIQNISTVPAGFAGNSSTAEILCHPSGKWIYVSNRGDDSLAVYQVLGDGKLELVEITKCPAEPRGCEIDPTGQWLVVAGQKSDEIVAMKIDQATGKLTSTNHPVKLGKPVSIVFD